MPEKVSEINQYFKLYASCVIVKGTARSTVCDLQRKAFYIITHQDQAVIEMAQLLGVKHTQQYFSELANIDSLLKALVDEQLGFFCDASDIDCFPPLDLVWDYPARITNAIIDFDRNSTHNILKIFNELEDLGCKFIQLRFFDPISMETCIQIIEKTVNSRITSVEFILPYDNNQVQEMIGLKNQYARISALVFHSVTPGIEMKDEFSNNVRFVTDRITSADHCGVISPYNFDININTFMESQSYNSCLNRKISVDVKGRIKNCPSMTNDFGNIKDVSLHSALLNKEFTSLWMINKDQIEVCKNCEFRYICTDCRAYTSNFEKLGKPSKCTYNPDSGYWDDFNI